MKLIVALGNPDPEYAATRHNVGWQFLEWLRKKYKAGAFADEKKLNARIAKADIDGTEAQLIEPTTYVNE